MSYSDFRIKGVEPEAVYKYEDGHGNELAAVARFSPGALCPRRTFRQFRRAGDSWRLGLDDLELPLYGSLMLRVAVERDDAVFVVEGEKDVHVARSIGLTATTNAGGAGKWRQRHTEALRGANVVVIADNDDPGRRHARAVAGELHGVARRVRVIDGLPGVPEQGGDLSDWIELGNGSAELLNLLNGLEDRKFEEEWPEPVPFPSRDVGEPLSLEAAMPPTMREFARSASEHVLVDVAAIATVMPVVVSAAAGNAFSVCVNRKEYVEPCLARHVVIAAPPGERKSATFRCVTEPLTAWAKDEMPAWRRKTSAVQAQNAAAEERTRQLRRKSAKAEGQEFDAIVTQIAELEEGVKSLPRRPLAFVSNFTTPALVRLMHANGGGHAIFSGEGRHVVDQVLGQYRKDRQADDGVFLCGHAGDPLDRVRVGDEEQLDIPNPSLAVCVFVQPDKLSEMVGKACLQSSGFIARLNIVEPLSKIGLRIETGEEEPFPDDARKKWREAVARILRWRFEVVDRDGAFDPIQLRLCAEAMEARRQFFNEFETRQGEQGDLGNVTEFVSKLAGEAARLAGLFHLFQLALAGLHPEDHLDVPIECWRWAEAHQRWQFQETMRVLGLAREDADERLARRLLRYVARNRGDRSIVSSSDVTSFHIVEGARHAERLLRLLEERGLVRVVPPKGKQTTPRWSSTPRYSCSPRSVPSEPPHAVGGRDC